MIHPTQTVSEWNNFLCREFPLEQIASSVKKKKKKKPKNLQLVVILVMLARGWSVPTVR